MRNQLIQSQYAPIYYNLRQAVLTLNPTEAGLIQDSRKDFIWGVIMETGYPGATMTLITLADGTTSLYFSNGSGFIGCGQHPNVKRASQDLNRSAVGFLRQMDQVKTCELPKPGRVRFHVLTLNEIYSADCDLQALEAGNDPLSRLFQAAQGVITQIRLLDEERKKRGLDV